MVMYLNNQNYAYYLIEKGNKSFCKKEEKKIKPFLVVVCIIIGPD